MLSIRATEYREKIEDLDELDRNLPDKSESHSLSWYMSLRNSSRMGFETYLPLGNIFTGLFTRISQHPKSPKALIRKPGAIKSSNKTYRDWDYFRTKIHDKKSSFRSSYSNNIDKEELLVVGLSKLPMEIDAVKQLGAEYLNPKLLPKPFKEEVYVENYDKRHKKYKDL